MDDTAPEEQVEERDTVTVDPLIREQVRGSSWHRRWQAEAERCETMESALGTSRRELLATRQMVKDRDEEIAALRARIAELTEPAEAPLPPAPPDAPEDDDEPAQLTELPTPLA